MTRNGFRLRKHQEELQIWELKEYLLKTVLNSRTDYTKHNLFQKKKYFRLKQLKNHTL